MESKWKKIRSLFEQVTSENTLELFNFYKG
jgi:hypothetical protein